MENLATEATAHLDSSIGRRERKKLETRTALHQAALELFAGNGFRLTRISEIADAADVSESTFFRYFDSKEGVALEGVRQRAEAIVAAVSARPVAESPIDACLAVNMRDESVRLGPSEDNLPELELLRKTPELASKAHLILRKTVSSLAEEFARRLDLDVASLEVRLQTHALIAASIAALEVWLEDPGRFDLKLLSHQALQRLREGFDVTADSKRSSMARDEELA